MFPFSIALPGFVNSTVSKYPGRPQHAHDVDARMQLVIQFWFAAFLWASPAGGMLSRSQELRADCAAQQFQSLCRLLWMLHHASTSGTYLGRLSRPARKKKTDLDTLSFQANDNVFVANHKHFDSPTSEKSDCEPLAHLYQPTIIHEMFVRPEFGPIQSLTFSVWEKTKQ